MANCHITHCTSPCFFGRPSYLLRNFLHIKDEFASLPPPGHFAPIVGIVATDNGRISKKHRFGCGNSLLLVRPARGCGVLLRLRRTSASENFAACFVKQDGRDGCRVGFTPQEHAVGACGSILDGALVRVFEVFTPEHPNSHCRRNRGYALTEIVNGEDGLT